jgi:hypothetical protein
MHFFLLVIFQFSFTAQLYASSANLNSIDNDVNVIEHLFSIFTPRSKSVKGKFSTQNCKIPESKLMEMFFLRKKIHQKFVFSDQCDVQGDVALTVSEPFPVKLRGRNLQGVSDVNFVLNMQTQTDPSGIKLNLDASQGLLYKPTHKVYFSGQYYYLFNITNSEEKNNNAGGEVVIEKINDKIVGLKKKIEIN